MRSLSEIDTTSKRASRAAGFSWGISEAVSYTHLRAHETLRHLVCRLLLEKKKRDGSVVNKES